MDLGPTWRPPNRSWGLVLRAEESLSVSGLALEHVLPLASRSDFTSPSSAVTLPIVRSRCLKHVEDNGRDRHTYFDCSLVASLNTPTVLLTRMLRLARGVHLPWFIGKQTPGTTAYVSTRDPRHASFRLAMLLPPLARRKNHKNTSSTEPLAWDLMMSCFLRRLSSTPLHAAAADADAVWMCLT